MDDVSEQSYVAYITQDQLHGQLLKYLRKSLTDSTAYQVSQSMNSVNGTSVSVGKLESGKSILTLTKLLSVISVYEVTLTHFDTYRNCVLAILMRNHITIESIHDTLPKLSNNTLLSMIMRDMESQVLNKSS